MSSNSKTIRAIINFTTILLLMAVFVVVATPAAAGDFSLSIPSIEVTAPITPIYVKAFPDGSVTWDTNRLNMQVGYFDGTGWFGQAGNIVLGGHSELARGQADVFYKLDQVNVGDEIIATVDGTEYRYTVANVYAVGYEDLTPIYPTSNEQLTLITCELGSFSASNGVYYNRLVVVANRTG